MLNLLVLLLTLSSAVVGVPTRRGSDALLCPYIFGAEGDHMPSLKDFKQLSGHNTAVGKPMDIPSMAVAAALVAKSPKFVARMFLNFDGKQDGEKWQVPTDAILLPGQEANPDETDCRFSPQTSAKNLRDSPNQKYAILVEFPGGGDLWTPEYTGYKLEHNSDSSEKSAWVYLFQDTMLHYAQNDYENGFFWDNINEDPVENVQKFDSNVTPQDCKNLDRMLSLSTGMDATQKPIASFGDSEELPAVLRSMSNSPVLVIPKNIEHNLLSSDRIWIGMKAAKGKDEFSFYNPVEREYKTATLLQLKDIAKEIVYLNDHGSLPE